MSNTQSPKEKRSIDSPRPPRASAGVTPALRVEHTRFHSVPNVALSTVVPSTQIVRASSVYPTPAQTIRKAAKKPNAPVSGTKPALPAPDVNAAALHPMHKQSSSDPTRMKMMRKSPRWDSGDGETVGQGGEGEDNEPELAVDVMAHIKIQAELDKYLAKVQLYGQGENILANLIELLAAFDVGFKAGKQTAVNQQRTKLKYCTTNVPAMKLMNRELKHEPEPAPAARQNKKELKRAIKTEEREAVEAAKMADVATVVEGAKDAVSKPKKEGGRKGKKGKNALMLEARAPVNPPLPVAVPSQVIRKLLTKIATHVSVTTILTIFVRLAILAIQIIPTIHVPSICLVEIGSPA
ncbi:hypothetical protein FRC09_012139 [Ceratobasidium sp. 395]|nr:hypothetical protein FRC09_012139 [Ceratobasidium sp. 395]